MYKMEHGVNYVTRGDRASEQTNERTGARERESRKASDSLERRNTAENSVGRVCLQY